MFLERSLQWGPGKGGGFEISNTGTIESENLKDWRTYFMECPLIQ